MNPLISLICRIASGEKLEPATKRNTAYWLSALVMTPLFIIGFASLAGWLESKLGSLSDSVVSLILFIGSVGLAFLGAVFSLAKISLNHPRLLILVSCATWGMTALIMWRLP